MTNAPTPAGMAELTPVDYLRLIAEGYDVIEATGSHMTIQSPDDEGPQELVIDIEALAAQPSAGAEPVARIIDPSAWAAIDKHGVHHSLNVQQDAEDSLRKAERIIALYPHTAPVLTAEGVETGHARTAVVNIIERHISGWAGEHADNPYDAAAIILREILALFATHVQPDSGGVVEHQRLIEEANDFTDRMTGQPWACELIEKLRAALAPVAAEGGDVVDARRYRYLRDRDAGPDGELPPSGPFIGQVPENLILTGEDADAAIDAALRTEPTGGGEGA